jgi:hypothetical protein
MLTGHSLSFSFLRLLLSLFLSLILRFYELNLLSSSVSEIISENKVFVVYVVEALEEFVGPSKILHLKRTREKLKFVVTPRFQDLSDRD